MMLLLKKKNLWPGRAFILMSFLFLVACKKDDGVAKTPVLTLVEQSLPQEELPHSGGSFSIEVEWAYNQWRISAGEVVEGSAFVSDFSPVTGGSATMGETTVLVNVSYKANDQKSRNVQKVTLYSLTDESLSTTFTLIQEAKPVTVTHINVDPAVTFQTIAGFGGANMIWGSDFLTADEVKKVFGTGNGELGLSIMRVRIGMYESDWPALVPTLQEAMKHNVKIIASPWSPPPALKSNNSAIDGRLLYENYAAYAQHLNKFVEYMNAQGISIYSVSLQNEPDITVSYESCRWSPQEMLTFIKEQASVIKNTKISAAESFNFKQSFTDLFLNDADAVEKFDIVAGHIYGGGLASYPLAEAKGKEIWMTEYLMNQNSGADPDNWNTSEDAIWTESMAMLETVHDAMRYNWNAYLWWYIRRFYSFLGDGEYGNVRGAILKRGYAFSHFAKEVRPGYHRISAVTDNASSLRITAYSGEGKTVVVIINPLSSDVSDVQINVPGTVTSARAYTTSENMNLKEQTGLTTDAGVRINLPGKSITTVVME